jgi:transposase
MLTNVQKEAIVIEMLKEGRSIREIAKAAQKSFSDIGEIKRRVLGESTSYKKKKKLSKVAQALELFFKNKIQ